MSSLKTFRPTLAALLVAVASQGLQASMVRDDVDYQYFRDFAENKGQFSIGAKNVPVYNKQGAQVGTMLPNVPMPDLSVASRTSGVATLFNPQYVASVSHNQGYGSIQFGENSNNNPDSHHFNYLLVDRNNHATLDFHAPRLHKLVTEAAPIAVNELPMDGDKPKANAFLDKARYPYFVRLGSGLQRLRDNKNESSSVAGGYVYSMGGTALNPASSNGQRVQFAGNLFNEALHTYGLPGDSGSPLFAYDAKENRWVLAAVLATYYGYKDARNDYTVMQNEFIANAILDDELQVNVKSDKLNWNKRSENSSVLQNGSENVEIALRDPKPEIADDGKKRPSLAHGKTVHFSGRENSTFTLSESLHQGAGALHFNNNMTVKGATADTTWEGAGVVVNGDKQVNWQVKNPQGDRLSKLGTGTLYVNGAGKNLGDISVGDGTVVLDQKALNGEQQAFNQVGITSGRGTVVLANTNQINPDNLYFGFRGGRLDLNGNGIAFQRIQNADDGAQIVNHNKNQTASLTVTGNTQNFTADNIEWVNWRARPTTALGLYEYTNRYQNGQKNYFVLKDGGNPGQYFPVNMSSNAHWEYLGNNKEAAIQTVLERAKQPSEIQTFAGYLGETDSNRHNGALNVFYKPARNDSSWLLNGGANLNGNINVENGNLLLSGIPVPHAYDHLNKKEVVKEDEWIDRQFAAKAFNVSGNASLTSGRNVARIQGNLNASEQATLNLGFVQGKSSECIRSSWTGKTQCQENTVLSDRTFEQLPTTQIVGNVQLHDQSQFNLGKAHLIGGVQAEKQTQMQLQPSSQWTLTQSSDVGNLTLAPSSVITLNQAYTQESYNSPLRFNQLTINGNLNGDGTFRYLTNAAEERGDRVVVNGLAQGSFVLALKNTGKEPAAISPLSLFKLNHAEQKADSVRINLENGFVDLGAYRYILANRNNDYRLYNPLKDAEQNNAVSLEMVEASKRSFEQAKAQAEAKNQELARLNEAHRQAQAKQTADQATIKKLQSDIQQTQSSLNRVHRELYGHYRLRAAKRQQLYQQYAQLQRQANQQQNALRTANRNAPQTAKQLQNLTALLNQAKQAANQTTTAQNRLQSEMAQLENRYAQNLTKAQQLCEAQGLSAEICSKVAKVANESDVSAFENALDIAIEQMEAAQTALEQAQQQGNAESIAAANQALETASNNLADRLEEAYSVMNNVEQLNAALPTAAVNTMLADTAADTTAQNTNTAIPAQATLISRYANTAVSELSANVNAALQIGRNLDRTLLDQNRANVWANTESTKQSYRSDYYRPYKQTLTLNQIGVAHDVNERVQIGAVLSHSRGNNSFDENVSGKNRLTSVNAFIKGNWENGIFASLDVGYGRSRNTLNFDGQENTFRRHIFSAGANAGVRWDWGVNVQPSVGVRYYRLSGANYTLAEAQVESKALNLTTYRAGLALDKTFDLGGVQLKPSLASYYYDASQRKLAVNGALAVNNIELNQQFGRYFNHEVGLSAGFNQWQISTHLGMLKGSDVAPQKYAAFKLGYTW